MEGVGDSPLHGRVFQIALRGEEGGLEILLGGGDFFLLGWDLHKEFFSQSSEAFVMLKLIFHIY